ncbi:Metalloenzyme, LuxS/M16 peptidase-like protein [Pilobolus umbonatus]|nr:Metalloenzyme, LuxS/M16 peptidase-like protein [Pilobolus umbonatus]
MIPLEDFICFTPFKVDPCETIEIKRYRSSKTGLTAVHADIDGPLVSGFLSLGTKVTNDEGYPHTLEHLVFLGSEKYPYKGALDLLAPRAYAPGTNAWTDIDHTCYTITTAGSDGFLQLLPIYVDHILYPTLTEEGFCTEIHHIDQNGADAGVVYCEMQSRENSMVDIMQRKLQHMIYPPETGYQHEAGGLIDCIRSLKIESIRDYHSEYYRPDNLIIVITGKMDQAQLLSTLRQIDKSILSRTHHSQLMTASIQKPWMPLPVIPNMESSSIETVYFPSESSSLCEITAFLDIQAIHILNSYLVDTPIAPLNKLFVEHNSPYCTELDFRVAERSRLAMTLGFQNVPIEKADEIVPMLIPALNEIYYNQQIDMQRMKILIEKERLKVRSSSSFNTSLYGEIGNDDFIDALQQAKYLRKLANFSRKEWLALLKRTYLDVNYAAIIGKPSQELLEQIMEDETIRLDKQRISLGIDDIVVDHVQLQSMDNSKSQIPSRIMENFPIPSVSSISSIDVSTAVNPYYLKQATNSNDIQLHINNDGDMNDIPYFIQYDQISSAFITLSVYMNTSHIPSHLRPYGRIYMDMIFASPLLKDGKYISHSEVVQKLDSDIISYDATLGYQAAFREYIVVTIKVEASKYKSGVDWLQHLMWDTQFTHKRLVVAINKTLNDIPQAKQNGKLVKAIHTDITKSTEASCSYLYQDTFLPRVLKQLEINPDKVIQDINEYRSILCQAENLRIHVMGNILNIDNPKSAFQPWKEYQSKVKALPPVVRSRDVLGPYGLRPGYCTNIIILPSTESSFSVHSTKGPQDYDSEEIPSLLVLFELLHAMEGIYTRMVRGLGLAYKCWLTHLTEAGLITLFILRSSNILNAYDNIKLVTHQLVQGDVSFNKYALEGAKSSVIFDIADSEGTKEVAASQSFINKVLRQSDRQKVDFFRKVQDVTMDDIQKVLLKYIVPLFDPATSNHVIVTSHLKAEEMVQSLDRKGHSPSIIRLEEIYALNIFQPPV